MNADDDLGGSVDPPQKLLLKGKRDEFQSEIILYPIVRKVIGYELNPEERLLVDLLNEGGQVLFLSYGVVIPYFFELTLYQRPEKYFHSPPENLL